MSMDMGNWFRLNKINRLKRKILALKKAELEIQFLEAELKRLQQPAKTFSEYLMGQVKNYKTIFLLFALLAVQITTCQAVTKCYKDICVGG